MRRHFPSSWHLWGREFLAHFKILNANKIPGRSDCFGPDVVVHVFCDSYNHSNRPAIGLIDPSELPVAVDREGVVNTDPQSACMIFE
jgi:hypothetical protein